MGATACLRVIVHCSSRSAYSADSCFFSLSALCFCTFCVSRVLFFVRVCFFVRLFRLEFLRSFVFSRLSRSFDIKTDDCWRTRRSESWGREGGAKNVEENAVALLLAGRHSRGDWTTSSGIPFLRVSCFAAPVRVGDLLGVVRSLLDYLHLAFAPTA